VQNDVWNESAHGGNTLLTLVKLADNADDESREAWPSVALLTEKTRASRRTVQRALRELQGGGDHPPEIIAVGPSRKRDGNDWTTTYRIIIGTPEYERRKGEWEAAREGGRQDDAGAKTNPVGASNTPSGGVTMTPGTQREPSEEPKALPAASAREPELEDVSVPSELGAAFAEVTAILDRVAEARGAE